MIEEARLDAIAEKPFLDSAMLLLSQVAYGETARVCVRFCRIEDFPSHQSVLCVRLSVRFVP